MAVIKVSKGIVVNMQQFRQTVGAFVIAMGGKAAKHIKRQARLFCEDMLDYTKPWVGGMGGDGRSRAAQKAGQRVVRSQLDAIFLPLRYVSAGEILQYGSENVFYAWLNARKSLSDPKLPDWLLVHPYSSEGTTLWRQFQGWGFAQQGAAMSAGLTDLSGYYKQNIQAIHVRSRGGNTVPDYFYDMEAAAMYGQRYVVDDDGKMVDAYSKRVEAHVGRLKAGWYTAGSQLGKMNKVGQWIIGNQWGTGILNNQLDSPMTPAVTVGNRVQGLHRATKDGYFYALQHRAYSMRVELTNKLVKNGNANLLFHIASHYNIGGGWEIT